MGLKESEEDVASDITCLGGVSDRDWTLFRPHNCWEIDTYSASSEDLRRHISGLVGNFKEKICETKCGYLTLWSEDGG